MSQTDAVIVARMLSLIQRLAEDVHGSDGELEAEARQLLSEIEGSHVAS